MAMTKAEKQQMEALALGAESVCKANKILVSAIKKTIKDNPSLADGDNCTLIRLKTALEKVKKGVVVKGKVKK